MALESYTMHGHYLPIGQLVCGNCKEKNLRGVDFSSSQVYPANGLPCTTAKAAPKSENKTDAVKHNEEPKTVVIHEPPRSLKRHHSSGKSCFWRFSNAWIFMGFLFRCLFLTSHI